MPESKLAVMYRQAHGGIEIMYRSRKLLWQRMDIPPISVVLSVFENRKVDMGKLPVYMHKAAAVTAVTAEIDVDVPSTIYEAHSVGFRRRNRPEK